MAFPHTYNFNYYSGDLYQMILYPKDGEEYWNFSGQTVLFTVSTERGNPDAIVFSASPQISASPSRLICTISPDNGILLTGASYLYDIETKEGNVVVQTFMTGTISTLQNIIDDQ